MIHLKLTADDLFDSEALAKALGLSRIVLKRARMAGKLRCHRAARKAWYRGDWVRDWLTGTHAGTHRNGVAASNGRGSARD